MKFICDLRKVPNWCLVIIGIMNQVDQNINKDMFDSDLIDVESLDYSDDQTWWVPFKNIYVRELVTVNWWWTFTGSCMSCVPSTCQCICRDRRGLFSLFQLIVELFISSLTTLTGILTYPPCTYSDVYVFAMWWITFTIFICFGCSYFSS